MIIDFSKFKKKKGVYFLTPEDPSFSKLYLEVRKKEQRILSDDQVKKLPDLNLFEWNLRKKSTERFLKYISNKNINLNILEVGCGNGWFSNKIAEVSKKNIVYGLDINNDELEQAARVFQKRNMTFIFADIFKIEQLFKQKFDIIVLNGTVQYFKDFKDLIALLKLFLNLKGELHILDSPFYQTSRIIEAKNRSKDYFNQIDVPEMANQYFHHDEKLIANFKVLYKPSKSILNKVLGIKDSPFKWVFMCKL